MADNDQDPAGEQSEPAIAEPGSNQPRVSFRILVDADACPQSIKKILFRTVSRLRVPLVLVANQGIAHPKNGLIEMILVPHGPDVADARIAEMVQSGDIVITQDIPLAAIIVKKGAIGIGTRGELFDDETVHGRLASRNLMEQFRSAGVETSGPKPLSQKDVQTFANQLDRLLAKRLK